MQGGDGCPHGQLLSRGRLLPNLLDDYLRATLAFQSRSINNRSRASRLGPEIWRNILESDPYEPSQECRDEANHQ